MENKKFNQKKYITEYEKEHYTQIKFKLKKDDAEEFKKNLADENIGITEFFKKCVKNYKNIIKSY